MKYLLLVIFGICIGLILGEILLSVVFFFRDKDLPETVMKDYPFVYYTRDESSSRYINKDGLETKYGRKKPAGIYRIILTGGSVARSSGTYEESIASHLEKELNKRAGKEMYQVVNGAISSFIVEQELIFTRFVLENYEPDMIIGLDGYNNIYTLRLNHHFSPPYPYPPHNWRHFKVINDNERKSGFLYRVRGLFKSITRAVEFIRRKELIEERGIHLAGKQERKKLAVYYMDAVDDLKSYCEGKNIAYYSFLQPWRGFNPHERDTSESAVTDIYHYYREGYLKADHGFDLTRLFLDKPDYYTDICHNIPEGNRDYAKAMADSLWSRILNDRMIE